MITISRIQKIGKRLTYPCPLCGGVVYSLLCKEIDNPYKLPSGRFCLTLGKNNDPPFDYNICHVFCSFICNKRNISIDSSDVNNSFVKLSYNDCFSGGKMYEELFGELFQKIQLDRGYKI